MPFLFTEKLSYVKNKSKTKGCILCKIARKDKEVKSLEVFRKNGFIISMNLYPYNPGHLIIFPEKHILSLTRFKENEVIYIHRLSVLSMGVLKNIYGAESFNIGYNIGNPAGASIKHIHMHIVPRFPNEPGLLEVINSTRVIVQSPQSMIKTLKKEFKKKYNEKKTG